MKIAFHPHRTRGRRAVRSPLETGHSSPAAHSASLAPLPSSYQSGVALVITLILLSVTLVMAIAFLALSKRERGSVSTETDTTTAKFAADAALAQAEAQIVSGILATTNPYVTPLVVSTNYICANGFEKNSLNATNVNYNNYVDGSTPLAVADYDQNIANLYYLPRPPVFATNLLLNTYELQFYLDLNRNGRFDTNGIVTNVDNDLRGLGTTSQQVGDPEWIGVLEHPDQPHGPNNPFIARYAFIAVPADSLDLNSIHNQALDPLNDVSQVNNPKDDGYWRDQGVGTWEINLAAFLTDLNSNRWDPPTEWNNLMEPYIYPEGPPGNSVAFDDARNLIAWRYDYSYPLLTPADALYGSAFSSGSDPFRYSGIDTYSVGRQVTFDTNFALAYGNTVPAYPWLGADNTNNFFSSPSELFNPNESSAQFVTNLYSAGTNFSTYDRYTFYRLLGQLGTDSSTESAKINLNYSNALVQYDILGVPTNITVIPNAETNFMAWRPDDFFTAAGNAMLHTYTENWFESGPSNYMQTYYALTARYFTNLDGVGITNIQYYGQTNQIPEFGITNIPVYINGVFVYTPAVNRVLQLAANIYDATTNTMFVAPGMSNYPSVFRPIFWVTNEYNYALSHYETNVYIKGYEYTIEPFPFTPDGPSYFTTPLELTALAASGDGIYTNNVWGVPWIIGAKKGLPNFNAFEMENALSVERELQVTRNDITPVASGGVFPYGRTYTTNQMYIMSVSNFLGAEDWNSYASNYNNEVDVVARDYLTVAMTVTNNGSGGMVYPFTSYPSPFFVIGSTNVSRWSGYLHQTADPSFILPLTTNTTWLTNSVYYYGTGTGQPPAGFSANSFIPVSLDPSNYLDAGTPPLPQMNLLITNRLQAYMLDTHLTANNSYILDYVQLGGMDNNLNVNNAIADNGQGYTDGLWSTNYYNQSDVPDGVLQQILSSETGHSVPSEDLNNGNQWPQTSLDYGQQAFFSAFMSGSDEAQDASGGTVSNLDYSVQVPYTPVRLAVQRFVYAANDPLVHYITSDLNDSSSSTNGQRNIDNPPLAKLGVPNDRYGPWGTAGNLTASPVNGLMPDQNAYNLSYKDPLVYSSDNWDFPSYPYPTVGWLGRVHRGTPWQTVFLKSTNLMELSPNGLSTWQVWTGNQNLYDADNTAPVQDRLLFDIFTAAPNDNATRGQLNVNVGADDPYNPLAGLASWSALLSGAVVLSNDVNNLVIQYPPKNYLHYAQSPLVNELPPSNAVAVVNPAGAAGFDSAMARVVANINSTRTNFIGTLGIPGVFEHAGDVLAASALSDGSPFLNVTNDMVAGHNYSNSHMNQIKYGISDEMYEWLPQQVMSLVTASGPPQNPPRYVVYCYGQTLAPAPNGVVTTGTFFGLCTNYQVVAETGARVVIRIDNAPTPANPAAKPHIVIEQYNALPPD